MQAEEAEVAIVEDMARFRHDPLKYVLYAFPWGEKGTELEHAPGPRQWQRVLLERIGKRLKAGACSVQQAIREAVSSGHGIGKSALVAWLVLWSLSTAEDARAVVTANTEKQLQTKTSPEIAKWHRMAINGHWFKYTTTSLFSADPEHEKTWRLDLVPWSEHNTEAFAGLHNKNKRILIVFDEASKIADKVWEVAEGALTDEDTEILWIVFGNPTRSTGRFRECFRRYRHRWETTMIDSRTVEGINKAQLQQLVDDHGEDSDLVKVRVRGMFPAQSLKQFISEADVDACYGRHLRDDQFKFAPVILSLDNAWEGDDELVIGMRQGLMFRILYTSPKNDNDIWVANKLARLEDEYQADAVFIDGGYGTGVVSAGRTMNRDWTLVWFSEASSREGPINKRAEMWDDGRLWLKQGAHIPKDPVLRDDLLGPETVPRFDGKTQLEGKKDMKARGLPSPGRGDAWALTFAHPVASKRGGGQRNQGNKALTDYDPWAVAS